MKWRIRISAPARLDIERALIFTLDRFGEAKHDEYVTLIGHALNQIARNPHQTPAVARPELHADARTFHIGRRGKPARHQFVYRIGADGTVEIARFLHDAMDVARQVPGPLRSRRRRK